MLVKEDNKIESVWHDAMWNDDGVDINGKNYTDFNKAIPALFAKWDTEETYADAPKLLRIMKTEYSKLKTNVTPKNEERLQNDKKIYEGLLDYHTLISSPTGSYNTFSNTMTTKNNAVNTALTKNQ